MNNTQEKESGKASFPPIYVISGGRGVSGTQLVHTVLVQFPEFKAQVIIVPHVRHMEQVEDALIRAAETGGTIVHTMVDDNLRNELIYRAKERGITTIDLMGPLLSRLISLIGQAPLGQPGLYHKLHQEYFERVAAIEYSIAHDDGQNPEGWHQAEIVLTGVSRVGKTPLSMYLSVLGWKVANIPIVMGLPVQAGLFALDRSRVTGLDIQPEQLMSHRRQRLIHMGVPGLSEYTDPAKIKEELEYAHQVFRKGGLSVIDVTHKPIESSADEVIELVTRSLKQEPHK